MKLTEIDYRPAREVGYTHGSTAAYVAGLIIEGGNAKARNWADEARGFYTRRGRHELVDTVTALLAQV